MQRHAARDLGPIGHRVQFVGHDVSRNDWTATLGQFDAVIAHQALHEMCDRRNIVMFNQKVKSVLSSGGIYLVCEHYADAPGMHSAGIYMTLKEQQLALLAAGFSSARQILCKGNLVLFRAEP